MFRYTPRILIIYYTLLRCVKCQHGDVYTELIQLLTKVHDYNLILLPTVKKDSEPDKSAHYLTNTVLRNGDNRKRYPIEPGEHLREVIELKAFMMSRPNATHYFYKEMVRIKRQNVVKDDLRKMVTILENIPEMKKEIMKLFKKLMKNVSKVRTDFWAQQPNDLVINQFGGSLNDNTFS